jgi:hypothetical protein
MCNADLREKLQANCHSGFYTMNYLRQLSTPLYFPAKYALIHSSVSASHGTSGLQGIPSLELFVPSLSPRAVELLRVLSLSTSNAVSLQQHHAQASQTALSSVTSTCFGSGPGTTRTSVFTADILSQLQISKREEQIAAQSNITVCTAAAIGCNASVGQHIESMAQMWSSLPPSGRVQLEKAGVESADLPEILEKLLNIGQR